MAITGSSLWIDAVGGSILTTCLFTMLTAIGSIVLLVFVQFNILAKMDKNFKFQLYVIVTVISLFLSCILMGISTSGYASQYSNDISDYITRNPNATNVVNFVSDHPTTQSRTGYVLQRTSNAYDVTAVFFALWLIALVIAVGINHYIEHKKVPENDNSLHPEADVGPDSPPPKE